MKSETAREKAILNIVDARIFLGYIDAGLPRENMNVVELRNVLNRIEDYVKQI